MSDRTTHGYWDPNTLRVFGFFVAKGLLVVPHVKPMPNVKLDLEEVLRVGEEVEPRVLEVLPAAILRFPKTFLNFKAAPEVLRVILSKLRNNELTGPDFGGIPYANLRRWANHKLPDNRTLPIKERRVMKSFRFKPATIRALVARARKEGISETEVLEKMIDA